MERLKIKITPSFWVFLALSVLLKRAFYTAVYFVAVFLHELSHYLVAKRLFYQTENITLSCFGAVLYGNFSEVERSDGVLIALAGPFANLVVAVVCVALWWMFPPSYVFTDTFVEANIALAVINLLPCYPLDGGRVFSAVVGETQSQKRLKVVTVVVATLLLTVFVWQTAFGEYLYSVGIFAVMLLLGVFTKSGGEVYVRTSFVSGKRLRVGMEKKTLVFDSRTPFSKVVKRMKGSYLYEVDVVDSKFKVVKHFAFCDVDKLLLACPPDVALADAGRYLER